jgi:hypothetical protein
MIDTGSCYEGKNRVECSDELLEFSAVGYGS